MATTVINGGFTALQAGATATFVWQGPALQIPYDEFADVSASPFPEEAGAIEITTVVVEVDISGQKTFTVTYFNPGSTAVEFETTFVRIK